MGFYDEANLNVAIDEYQSGVNTTQKVLENKNHFAVGQSSLLVDLAQGRKTP